MHVLLRVGHLEEQQLGDDDVGNHVIHRRADEKNAVHEQSRVNVPTPLAATGLFDHDRHKKIFFVHVCSFWWRNVAEAHESVKATHRLPVNKLACNYARLSSSVDDRLERRHPRNRKVSASCWKTRRQEISKLAGGTRWNRLRTGGAL